MSFSPQTQLLSIAGLFALGLPALATEQPLIGSGIYTGATCQCAATRIVTLPPSEAEYAIGKARLAVDCAIGGDYCPGKAGAQITFNYGRPDGPRYVNNFRLMWVHLKYDKSLKNFITLKFCFHVPKTGEIKTYERKLNRASVRDLPEDWHCIVMNKYYLEPAVDDLTLDSVAVSFDQPGRMAVGSSWVGLVPIDGRCPSVSPATVCFDDGDCSLLEACKKSEE